MFPWVHVCWFSIICLPAPKSAEIACLWSWKLSTFHLALTIIHLSWTGKGKLLNAGLAETCLPASFLSHILWLLLSGKLKKTNPLHRVSQQRNRTKLTKNWGKRENFGCSFTRQFQLTQNGRSHYFYHLLFLLRAPPSHHLSSAGSGSQQIGKLTYPSDHHIGSAPKKCKYMSRHEGGGGTTQPGVGSRNRVMGRADLPVQQ